MTITLTIPDPVAPRVIDAMSIGRGWTAAEPKTKAQYALSQLYQMLKQHTRQYESGLAVLAASAAVDTEIVFE